ncbi:MAG: hypothetical protein HRO68_10205 [Nitrosopumilus sp.]|nr:hypothetical protein [Nitrosopumilus sp.]
MQKNLDCKQIEISIENNIIKLRKPTGNDQLKWHHNNYASELSMIKDMIDTLCIQKKDKVNYTSLTKQKIHEINEKMDEVDPLINYKLKVDCPYCNIENNYELNLEEITLKHLKGSQDKLLQTIHRLASHYHWNEKQIFSLSPWRRAKYLTLIEKEILS